MLKSINQYTTSGYHGDAFIVPITPPAGIVGFFIDGTDASAQLITAQLQAAMLHDKHVIITYDDAQRWSGTAGIVYKIYDIILLPN